MIQRFKETFRVLIKDEIETVLQFCSPSYDQLLDFWFPHEQDEDDESLKTVKKIADIEHVCVIKHPRNGLHAPRYSHYNE